MHQHRIAAWSVVWIFLLASALARPAIPADAQERSGTEAADAAEPAAATPATPALVDNIQGMLDEGFQSGPKHLQAAQKKLAAARTLAGEDPRIDFAYGLVLLRHGQSRQAAAQFELAIGRPGATYQPAWKALIWTHLTDRQYEKGLGRLDEFAASVRESGSSTDITDPQRDAARWIGQILEALDKSVTARKLHETIEQHDTRIRELLGDELYSTVQLGRDLVEERDTELSKQTEGSEIATEKTRAQRQQADAAKLESDLKDFDKEKASTARSAEEWKDWLDDNLGKSDKELERLDKDYRTLESRLEALNQSVTEATRDLIALQLQMNAILSTGGAGTVVSQTQQRLLQRQNQLVASRVEYNATISRMAQIAQQGQIGNQKRAAIVRKYEKATGQLVKKNAELDRWSSRAAEKKKRLETSGPGKARGQKSAGRKSASLKSYVPLDLDDEKGRVLMDFGVAPEPIGVDPPDDATK